MNVRGPYDTKEEQGWARIQVAALENLVNIGFKPNQFVQLPSVHRHYTVYQLRAVPAAKPLAFDERKKGI